MMNPPQVSDVWNSKGGSPFFSYFAWERDEGRALYTKNIKLNLKLLTAFAKKNWKDVRLA